MTSNAAAVPFILKEAVLKTNRIGSGREISHDIRSAIVDFNVYEHITKPYCTAHISFADTKDTLSSLDIQGGEYIDILVESAHYSETPGIEKRFHVMKIAKGVRAGENAEVVVLSCIDEIGFRSYLQNVNVLLQGTSIEMLVRIAQEYLDVDLIHSEEKFEQLYKIIVPNYHPLKAMRWIARKSLTSIGMPHFLFSTFSDDALRYLDLEDLLAHETVNESTPFTYGFTAGNLQNLYDFGAQTYSISSYSYENAHDIGKIINEGALSGSHSHFDTLRNRQYTTEFRATELFRLMFEIDLFDQDQQRVPIAPAMTHQNKRLEEFMSRKKYHVTTGPFNDGFTAYGERTAKGAYVMDTSNEMMRYFMAKDTLTWTFSGKHFASLAGGKLDGAHIIGKKLRVVFSKADPDAMSSANAMVDMKKSGDYLITGVKHELNKESYNIVCTGSKLATLNSNTYATGISSNYRARTGRAPI